MVLRDGEYEINGDKITIPKKVLEEFRDHYKSLSFAQNKPKKEGGNRYLSWMYMGKYDVCVSLLKMFEPLEP